VSKDSRKVERKEAEWPAAPHQLVEQWLSIRPEADDLAVQDGGPAGEMPGRAQTGAFTPVAG
jgi:hypothetical protein